MVEGCYLKMVGGVKEMADMHKLAAVCGAWHRLYSKYADVVHMYVEIWTVIMECLMKS